MAAALLVVGFAGFGRTFFFKSFFEAPDLPWYLTLHGAVLTVWFALLLAAFCIAGAWEWARLAGWVRRRAVQH